MEQRDILDDRPPSYRLLPLVGAVFITGLLLARRPPGPFEGRTDFYNYFLPLTELGYASIGSGSLPLWNAEIFTGLPLLGAIELGWFYPPNLVHTVLPASIAFNVLIVVHVVWAYIGTISYCRHLGIRPAARHIAGIAFALSSPIILHLWAGHISMFYSACWIPAVCWAASYMARGPTLQSAAVLSGAAVCQFLAGFPMFTLGILLLTPVLLFLHCRGEDDRILRGDARKSFAKCLGVAVVLAGFAVCAQVAASVELLRESHRAHIPYERALLSVMEPVNLLSCLVPNLFGDHVSVRYWGSWFLWESHLFVGAGILLLAIFALCNRPRRVELSWCFVGVLSVLVALGDATPVHWIAYHVVPGFDIFRATSKLVVFAAFAAAVLAGFGADRLLAQSTGERGKMVFGCAALAIGCVTLAVALLLPAGSWSDWCAWAQTAFPGPRPPSVPPPPVEAAAFSLATTSACVSALGMIIVGACALWLRRLTPRSVRLAPILLIGVAAVELLVFSAPYLRQCGTEPMIARKKHGIAQVITATSPAPMSRVSVLTATPQLNWFVGTGTEDIGGYENAVLRGHYAFLNALWGAENWHNTNLMIPYHEQLYQRLNVRYMVFPFSDDIEAPAGWEAISGPLHRDAFAEYAVYAREQGSPVRIAGRVEVVDSLAAAAQQTVDYLADTSPPAVLLEPPELEPRPEAVNGTVRVVARSAESLTIECDLPATGMLVISENFYSNLRADVDGTPVRVQRADAFMRGVSVPAGSHTVVVEYRPTALKGLTLVSIVAAGVITVLAVLPVWRRRKGGAEVNEDRGDTAGTLENGD